MSTQAQEKFKVLLIGDVCIDEYQYGTVDRISPEAPVPIFKFSHKESRPGMAANVNNNLSALGIETMLIGGEESTKTRLIDIKSKQQIVRIDDDKILLAPLSFDLLPPEVLIVDAIVISDYNKGLVSYELVETLRNSFAGPIFIDTKKTDLSRFNGCIVKINETEYNASVSTNDNMIITLGNKGAMHKTTQTETLYTTTQVIVTDVCGAGDTFLAALVYMYLTTRSFDKSIEFANKAAAVTVGQVGVYAPTLEEII